MPAFATYLSTAYQSILNLTLLTACCRSQVCQILSHSFIKTQSVITKTLLPLEYGPLHYLTNRVWLKWHHASFWDTSSWNPATLPWGSQAAQEEALQRRTKSLPSAPSELCQTAICTSFWKWIFQAPVKWPSCHYIGAETSFPLLMPALIEYLWAKYVTDFLKTTKC